MEDKTKWYGHGCAACGVELTKKNVCRMKEHKAHWNPVCADCYHLGMLLFESPKADSMATSKNMKLELIDTDKLSYNEMVSRIKNPEQKVMTTMGYLYKFVQETEQKTRSNTIKQIVKQLRVTRSQMCLKDRTILLEYINQLENYGD